jgi:hypothetical protein
LLISQADAKERNAENKRTRVDRKGLNRAIVRLGAKAWVNLQAEPGLLTRWSLLKPIELRMSSKDGCRSFRIRTKKKEKSGRAFYDFINNLQPTNNQSRPTSEKLLDLADMRELHIVHVDKHPCPSSPKQKACQLISAADPRSWLDCSGSSFLGLGILVRYRGGVGRVWRGAREK